MSQFNRCQCWQTHNNTCLYETSEGGTTADPNSAGTAVLEAKLTSAFSVTSWSGVPGFIKNAERAAQQDKQKSELWSQRQGPREGQGYVRHLPSRSPRLWQSAWTRPNSSTYPAPSSPCTRPWSSTTYSSSGTCRAPCSPCTTEKPWARAVDLGQEPVTLFISAYRLSLRASHCSIQPETSCAW